MRRRFTGSVPPAETIRGLNGHGEVLLSDKQNDGEGISRRAFTLVAVSGAVTAGLGLLGGGLFAAHRDQLLGPSVVESTSYPELNALAGTDRDATEALTAFLKSAGPRAVIIGRYVVDGAVVVPHSVSRLTLAAGSAIKVRGSHSALRREGSIVLREKTGHAMKEGATSFKTDEPDLYTEDEYLLLTGDNTVPNSKAKYGYLRRVTSIDGSTINIDRPLPRKIDKSPRTSAVRLAPKLVIDGSGEVFSLDPKKSTNSLVTLFAVEAPEVLGIEVHSNGGIGVTAAHCHDGLIDCTVRDLLDDGKRYFGYGVNVSGSTRGLVVSGFMTRVRHAVTTNAGGDIKGVGYAGEPEDCLFQPRAVDCSNKAIDTHRLGWAITMIPNVTGGAGGVQVRADNVTVRGGTVNDTRVSGITVASVVAVAPMLEGVAISNIRDGIGIRCRGPATINDCTVTDTSGVAVELSDGSVIDGLRISGGGPVGVMVLGKGNTVGSVTVDGRGTVPVVLDEGASDNRLSS